jgi:hypothetical protein
MILVDAAVSSKLWNNDLDTGFILGMLNSAGMLFDTMDDETMQRNFAIEVLKGMVNIRHLNPGIYSVIKEANLDELEKMTKLVKG